MHPHACIVQCKPAEGAVNMIQSHRLWHISDIATPGSWPTSLMNDHHSAKSPALSPAQMVRTLLAVRTRVGLVGCTEMSLIASPCPSQHCRPGHLLALAIIAAPVAPPCLPQFSAPEGLMAALDKLACLPLTPGSMVSVCHGYDMTSGRGLVHAQNSVRRRQYSARQVSRPAALTALSSSVLQSRAFRRPLLPASSRRGAPVLGLTDHLHA